MPSSMIELPSLFSTFHHIVNSLSRQPVSLLLKMRTAALLTACAAVAVASTPSKHAYIYTVDQSTSSSSTQFIDTALASSIIARRRGLTDSRFLNINDASMLDDLNAFGGWQQPLFGESTGEAPGKLFIRISGFDGGMSRML